MTLKDLIDLAGERDLSKIYPKAGVVYIWGYILEYAQDFDVQLRLVRSDSGRGGLKPALMNSHK